MFLFYKKIGREKDRE